MQEAISSALCGEMRTKTIREMSARYAVSFRTLRFYEEKGFLRPKRIGTTRLYSANDEMRLEIVLKGRQLGFSLAEIEGIILSAVDRNPEIARLRPGEATIATLTPALLAEKIAHLSQRRDEADAAIVELKQRIEERAAF